MLLAWVVRFPCHAVKAGHWGRSRTVNLLQLLGEKPCYGVCCLNVGVADTVVLRTHPTCLL